jgi:gliding motility-associated-like protein
MRVLNLGNYINRSSPKSSFLAFFFFIALAPNMLVWGSDILPTISGPTAVIAPALHYYIVFPTANFQIQWLLNSRDSEVKSGSPVGVFIQFNGRGVDTLIIRFRNVNTLAQGYDTLIIHKNTCPAIAGNITSNQEICQGFKATIALDTLIGRNIFWEYSQAPFTQWNNIAYPQKTLITAPLQATTRFRAVVFTEGCGSDTSAVTTVFVKPPPSGAFSVILPEICGGDTSVLLEGQALQGKGLWETNGKGSFWLIDPTKARYIAASQDSGNITITWKVISANCPPQLYSQILSVRPGPLGELQTVNSSICPRNLSEPIKVKALRGEGSWQPTPWGQIVRQENGFRFVPSFEARGRQVAISWVVALPGCQNRSYQQIFNVKNAGVATIENSRPEVVCRGGRVVLKATRRREYPGNYFWSTKQPISDPSINSPELFPAASDTVRLTFYDIFTGCTSQDSLLVRVVERQLIKYQESVTICAGARLMLNTLLEDSTGNLAWSFLFFNRERQAFESIVLPQPIFSPDTSVDVLFKREKNGCRQEGLIRIIVNSAKAQIKSPFPNFTGFCRGDRAFLRDTIISRQATTCNKKYWFATQSVSIRALQLIDPITGEINNQFLRGDTAVQIQNKIVRFFANKDSIPIATNPPDFNVNPGRIYFWCTACWDSLTRCIGYDDIAFRILPIPEPRFTVLAGGKPLNAQREMPFKNRQNVLFQNLTEDIQTENPRLLYSWDFGDPESGALNYSQQYTTSHNYTKAGRFRVTLVASNGACSRSAVEDFRILDETFYFPNAFTPNGDGIDDKFRPIPAYWEGTDKEIDELQNEIFMEIYNQWGQKVFSANKMSGWNGNDDQGNPLPSGNYTYQVRIIQTQINRKELKFSGQVTLLR